MTPSPTDTPQQRGKGDGIAAMNALTMRDHQRAYDNQSPPEDDGQPEDERIAEELGLPHYHWLADAIADAMSSGDAIFLLGQCRKHLAPRCAR